MINKLNEIIEKGSLEFGKFDAKNKLSTSKVNNLLIYMHPADDRLVFYSQIIKIDYEFEEEHPHVFKDILTAQALAYRFGDLTISFDVSTRLLWFNYSISLNGIDADILKNNVYSFAENAQKYGDLLIEAIFNGESNELHSESSTFGSKERNTNNEDNTAIPSTEAFIKAPLFFV